MLIILKLKGYNQMNQKQKSNNIEGIAIALEELTLSHNKTGEAIHKLGQEVEALKRRNI